LKNWSCWLNGRPAAVHYRIILKYRINIIHININNIDSIILCSWRAVKRKVEGGHLLSSEKTLCFLFALELYKKVGNNLVIDFENQCYSGLAGSSKYLDLLIYTSPLCKVAIEFKLPKKSSNGCSNSTKTREAIYRDIARLNWLKNNSITVSKSYFLMATDEDSYLNNTRIISFPDFLTKQNHQINNSLTAARIPLTGVDCSFQWLGISWNGTKYKKRGLYSWLKPIKV